jgi:hypothetical protein
MCCPTNILTKPLDFSQDGRGEEPHTRSSTPIPPEAGMKADADGPGWSDQAIAEAFSVHEHTVRNVRQGFAEYSINAAIERKNKKALLPPKAGSGVWTFLRHVAILDLTDLLDIWYVSSQNGSMSERRIRPWKKRK